MSYFYLKVVARALKIQSIRIFIVKRLNMKYIELLPHDFITIKDPTDHREIKLYRIISTQTFKMNVVREGSWNFQEDITIDRYTVGGYVESLDNINSDDQPVWISGSAKVWGKAKITNGTYLADSACVYGNAIVENSYIGNNARIFGKSQLKNSVCVDMVTVKDNTKLNGTIMLNQSMIYGNAVANKSKITGGSYVFGNSIITNTVLNDYSCIGGTSIVENTTLSARASIVNRDVTNQTLEEDVELNIVNPPRPADRYAKSINELPTI